MGLGPSVQSKTIFQAVQFRIGGKAFATLGSPVVSWAVVKVAPSRQAWACPWAMASRLRLDVAARPASCWMRLAVIN
jgi:hypothetical protein